MSSNYRVPAPDPQVAQLVGRVQVAHDRLGALRQRRYQDRVLKEKDAFDDRKAGATISVGRVLKGSFFNLRLQNFSSFLEASLSALL